MFDQTQCNYKRPGPSSLGVYVGASSINASSPSPTATTTTPQAIMHHPGTTNNTQETQTRRNRHIQPVTAKAEAQKAYHGATTLPGHRAHTHCSRIHTPLHTHTHRRITSQGTYPPTRTPDNSPRDASPPTTTTTTGATPARGSGTAQYMSRPTDRCHSDASPMPLTPTRHKKTPPQCPPTPPTRRRLPPDQNVSTRHTQPTPH